MLLGELLRVAGFEARLTSAALDPAAVQRLAGSARLRPALPAATIDGDALVTRMVGDLGLDPAGFKAKLAGVDAAAGKLVDRTRRRVTDQAAAIASLVPAGTAPGADAALAEHWSRSIHTPLSSTCTHRMSRLR